MCMVSQFVPERAENHTLSRFVAEDSEFRGFVHTAINSCPRNVMYEGNRECIHKVALTLKNAVIVTKAAIR